MRMTRETPAFAEFLSQAWEGATQYGYQKNEKMAVFFGESRGFLWVKKLVPSGRPTVQISLLVGRRRWSRTEHRYVWRQDGTIADAGVRVLQGNEEMAWIAAHNAGIQERRNREKQRNG